MQSIRTPIACFALLIQHTLSAAIPSTDIDISSSLAPRNSEQDAAGASGSSEGSINLKKRDQIAIIVVAALVVIVGG